MAVLPEYLKCYLKGDAPAVICVQCEENWRNTLRVTGGYHSGGAKVTIHPDILISPCEKGQDTEDEVVVDIHPKPLMSYEVWSHGVECTRNVHKD